MRHALILALSLTLGCGGGDSEEEAYDTLEDCFIDHVEVDTLPVVEALIVCCLEHPIAGVAPSCGATQDECEVHVGDEIAPADATDQEVIDACTGYIAEL